MSRTATSITAQAHQHETLDALAWRHLGTTRGVVEETLARNPGLARRGPTLPAGLMVELAQPETTAIRPTINLWD